MATETGSMSDRREHVRSIGVTAFAALLGIGAALASAAVTGGGDVAPAEMATDTRALAIVGAAVVVQLPLLNLSGIYDEDELGPKRYLFVAFMTFSLWFITWGILLTSEHTDATAAFAL